MKVQRLAAWGGWLLAVPVCLGISTLLAFGYRATREWQRSTEQLIERDTAASADLLVTALTRDMQGAHSRMLGSREWGQLATQSVSDTSDQVARAFARYPYPESFFSWRADSDHGVLFYNRANRYPPWMGQIDEPLRTAVVVTVDPPGSNAFRRQIDAQAASRFRYVALNTDLGGQPYQVIAWLIYADPLQEGLDSVIGFTVDLGWARRVYFAEILSQLGPIVNRGSKVDIAVLDDRERLIWGKENIRTAHIRQFPLLFLDPSASMVTLVPDSAPVWTVRASQASDSVLLAAIEGADETMLVSGAAALTLAIGLFFALRAVQAGIALNILRSDFVSSVTHELKMPVANIGTLANTLARRPISKDQIVTYAEYLMKETKRLSRLVDNLLAYSRITDVTNVYSFEPVAPAELVDDVLRSFSQPIADRGFTVETNIPADLPLVRADRAALELALDNLVDNAMRYSDDRGCIRITARHDESLVFVEVRDGGAGIPADELAAVQKKFVRGRMNRASGSGLGLAIVSRIVADHRGVFTLDSEYGAGSTARVGLPVAGE